MVGKMVKSKKFKGVYHRESKDGEITYYFTFLNDLKKTQYQKVGTKSEGIDESFVNNIRLQTITSIRVGTLPPKVVRNSKKYNTTVDEISDFYFTTHKTTSTEKRQRQYNSRLKPYFGKMSIYNVSPKHIETFKSNLLEEVSEQTTIIYIELLSTIFSYYIKKTSLKLSNPVEFVEKPRIDNRRERFLSKEEIDLLFSEIQHDFTMTLFLSLSLSTGGRKSTVMNYKIKDVDLSHNMINSYDFKNKSSYKSFLDDRTIELIKMRVQQTDDVNEPLVFKYGIHDLDRWISRQFKILFDSLFNKNLSLNDRKNRVVIHSLRHTVLSHLGMRGVNEFILKKISNHQSTQMVSRYVKLHEDSGKKEIINLWK